ncbi:o-succinylbenzoate synthase [Micropruina sp.]|uniref:o-succinylbenzoate synthase n=1 Tax=Micropruina sp. TaxID=2737536 RepID=UPI0039E2F38E
MRVVSYDVALTTRFRGVLRRSGLLLQGEAGWGEWSPFAEYVRPEIDSWWNAALEAATRPWPAAVRDSVPVNSIVPAVPAEQAARFALAGGCTTAKVKVAEPGQGLADDLARVEAVRDALGTHGRVRIDANGAWSVDQAVVALRELARFGLEYAEQPCAGVEELAELRLALARRGIDVPIAADESIRRSGDPERVAELEAADVAVLKVQPLGGVRRCLRLAERLGLPVVVSSALETSVGIAAGVALAAALPELPYACGLNTLALLAGDVTGDPLVVREGRLPVRRVAPEGTGWQASPELDAWWRERGAELSGWSSLVSTDHPPGSSPTDRGSGSCGTDRRSSASRPDSGSSGSRPDSGSSGSRPDSGSSTTPRPEEQP